MKPFSSKLFIDWPAVTALWSVYPADAVPPPNLPLIFCAVELKLSSMSALTLVDASVIFIAFSLMFHLSTALLTAYCSPASATIILYVTVPFARLWPQVQQTWMTCFRGCFSLLLSSDRDHFTSCRKAVDVTIAINIKTISISFKSAEDNCRFCSGNHVVT
jgi:hypothetical protein